MLEDTKGNILDRYLNDLAKAYYKTAAKVMEEKSEENFKDNVKDRLKAIEGKLAM